MARIAINGLGRMGKLTLRALMEAGRGHEIVLINEPGADAEQLALLLEFDSVHGRWPHKVGAIPDGLEVDGHQICVVHHRRIEELPLSQMGIDLVVECTGVFKTRQALAPYYAAGVAKVVVSAPVKGDALNLVYGVNHDRYDGTQDLITAASCTTNCIAPVVKVLQDTIGIRHGAITTIHDVTNTQTIVDAPAKDPRRARSALMNLIPTTTGSATAITAIFPELSGRLNGHAVRVPLLNASLTDCVFELSRDTTAQELNSFFKTASEGALAGILGYETRPLVSSDYLNDPRSAIIDGPSTMVVNGTQAKIYVWYDNEWGYASRLADVVGMVGDRL
ncbi:ArsJ-associated glyceraldehyde-3-phosphate dehydrogenase [Rhodobacteraceae bacterium]|nr:ArsJ-associated glyceraldehyde-3-phosphate dehydrogenase [Paracoccaceae bacterium]